MRRTLPALALLAGLVTFPTVAQQAPETDLSVEDVAEDVAVMVRCNAVATVLRDAKVLSANVLLHTSTDESLSAESRTHLLIAHNRMQEGAADHSRMIVDLQVAFSVIIREARLVGLNPLEVASTVAHDSELLAGRIRERLMDGNGRYLPLLVELEVETEECGEWQRDTVARR